MAAGPHQLSKDYINYLEGIIEDIDTMDHGLDYAPGWNLLESMDDWKQIMDGLLKVRIHTKNTISHLEKLKNKFPDKCYEDLKGGN